MKKKTVKKATATAVLVTTMCAPIQSFALTPAGTPINISTRVFFSAGDNSYESAVAAAPLVVGTMAKITSTSQTVALTPGQTTAFTQTFVNEGNATDRINLTANTPAGVTIAFFADDGVTPLTDTTGDGRVNTAPVPMGGSINVVIKATADNTVAAGQTINIVASSTADVATNTNINMPIVLAGAADVWTPFVAAVAPAGIIAPNDELTYVANFSNATGSINTNATVTAVLDSRLEYIEGSAYGSAAAATAAPVYNPATRTLTWSIPAVASSDSGVVGFRARVARAASDAQVNQRFTMVSDQSKQAETNTVSSTVVEQSLKAQIRLNKREVEVGEYVKVTINAQNASSLSTIDNAAITAALPRGFSYVKGTAYLNDVKISDSKKNHQWDIGELGPNKRAVLSFLAVASPEAKRGDKTFSTVFSATTPSGITLRPAEAAVKVAVTEGVFTSDVVVLGTVQDVAGNPIKGVRLYFEDGTYVTTDGEGKYSVSGVRAGEHVLKLDPVTIKGYKPLSFENQFAGDGNSRFVKAPFGGMVRADFVLEKEEVKQQAAVAPERTFTWSARKNELPLEKRISTMNASPEILSPANDELLKSDARNVTIKVPAKGEFVLRVNGAPIPEKKIGKTIVDKNTGVKICEYIGLRMAPGVNTIELNAQGAKKQVLVRLPGAPAAIVTKAASFEIPADGITAIPVSVSVVDKDGYQVTEDNNLSVFVDKGKIEVDGKVTNQVKATGGKAEFLLRSGTATGNATLKVSAGTGVETSIPVFFAPELRDWILVGLGSFTLGSNNVKGNIESLSNKDGFDRNLYHDDRVAFFAKGKVLGKYLLTAAYDSEKQKAEKLFQHIDPEKYYPIYGDESETGYDAASQRKYYVRIERDRSYLMAGDIETELNNTEFAAYNRQLNGTKLNIDTKNVTARGFAATTNNAFVKDELRGNGTSGYYQLSKDRVVEGSVRVAIETRDRFHSERVISREETFDYVVNYAARTLLFNKPVPSVDKDLNPVYIVVQYESNDDNISSRVAGGRVAVRSDNGSELGVSGITDERGTKETKVYGIDGTVKIANNNEIKGEIARSEDTEQGKGLAWKTEATTEYGRMKGTAYVRRVDSTFTNPGMLGAEIGTEKYGVKGELNVSEDPNTTTPSRIYADGYVEKDLVREMKKNIFVMGVNAAASSTITLDGGYKHVRGPGKDQVDVSGDMFYGGISYRPTDKLSLSVAQEFLYAGEHVQDHPTKTTLKGEYALTDRLSVFATQEFQQSGVNKGNNTVGGATVKLNDNMSVVTSVKKVNSGSDQGTAIGSELNSTWKPAEKVAVVSKTGYGIENTTSGSRNKALFGVNTSWDVTDQLKASFGIERTQLVSGTPDPSATNTAITLSAEHLLDNQKLTGKAEYRDGNDEDTYLVRVGGARKLTPVLSLLGRVSLWFADRRAGLDQLHEIEGGVAYRPLDRAALNLLGLAKVKLDRKGMGDKEDAVVVSVEGSKRVAAEVTVSGKYAAKLARQTVSASSATTYTDSMLAGVSYNVTRELDLSGYGKLTNQYRYNIHSVGAIAEAGYVVMKNVRVAVGYNFSRINDLDLDGGDYRAQGVFLNLKFKFDEMTVSGLYDRLAGK